MDSEEPERTSQEEAELAQLVELMATTPAKDFIAEYAVKLWEVAAVHLHGQPPNLIEAQLLIDAFGGMIDATEGRLGEDEPTLKEALHTIRLAYVQIETAYRSAPPTPTS